MDTCLQVGAAELSEEVARDDDDLCIVCWEELREVVFYHCMHMVRSCSSAVFFICHPYIPGVSPAGNVHRHVQDVVIKQSS